MVMKKPCHILATIFIVIAADMFASGSSDVNSPEFVTAILGQSVVLNCVIEFPDGVAVPYIVQWSKKGDKVPIYIWYAGYPPHKGDGYKGRISLVNQASINVSDVQEMDQGWYECNVLFLNRAPDSNKNGTWVHLDVHAPPHFTVTPLEVYYVKVGDSLILTCEADGTPKPSILWYKDEQPLEPTGNVQLYSNGHEVRITSLRQLDIGDYVCEARNGEGHITHSTKIIIAGGAVITTPPHNISKLESEKAEFICEARALPGNITYKWYRNDIDINELPWLSTRSMKRSDGTLVLNPLTADDTGKYSCEVSNGIGTPQSASAYLDVEFPARVSYTPTLQYLPLGLSGIIRCHFEANPPFQFVTWTKDRRVFKPVAADGIIPLNNGSLFIKTVSQEHQGLYTCTPFNEHTTGGASGIMEVLVREPPKFVIKPKEKYQSAVNGEVKMPCDAQGNPKPEVIWRRADGAKLPRDRTQMRGGNLTMKFLRKSDHGYYECVVQNEVATLVTSSLLIVEMSPLDSDKGTTPHAPTNLSVNTSAYAAAVSWLPAYDGGYSQTYVVWYRESNRGDAAWRTIRVSPDDATTFSVHGLKPETSYDFRVSSRNILGESMRTAIVKASTKSADPSSHINPTDATGSTYIPSIVQPAATEATPSLPGDNPATGISAPRNVQVSNDKNGLNVTWLAPTKTEVTSYTVEYKADGGPIQWTALNSALLGSMGQPPLLFYVFSNPHPGRTYHFRVLARTNTAVSVPSEVVQITVPVIERKDVGPKPSPPRNVSVSEVNDGVKISWLAPIETVVTPTYYLIEYRIDDNRWSQLGGPVRSTSYLLTNPLGGKVYFFRVSSRTATASSAATDPVKFNVPARFKDKAVTAGLVGGILFFIVAIILSICAVKICNKRKQRRHERAYSMVACRVTDVRNGGHGPAGSPVPLRKFTESRISGLNVSRLRRKVSRYTRLALGLGPTTTLITSLDESQWSSNWGLDSRNQLKTQRSIRRLNCPELDSRQTVRVPMSRRPFPRSVRYQVQMEYSQPAGYISRRADGRFDANNNNNDDNGGFDATGLSPLPSRQSLQMDSFFQSDDGIPWDVDVDDHRSPLNRIHTIYSPRDPKFRTSSPGPIARHRAELDLQQMQDLSSVLLPSSAERSFPNSTVSSRFTPNSAVFSPSYELPSLRVLHEHLPYIREELEPGYEEGYYDYPPRPRPYFGTISRHSRPFTEQIPATSVLKTKSPPIVVPHVIEWRQVPQHQADVYKRIQDLDVEQSRNDRQIARIPPSLTGRESGGSVSGSDDRPIVYTRDRLQEVIGQVRSQHQYQHQVMRPPFRDAVSDPILQGAARRSTNDGENSIDNDGDVLVRNVGDVTSVAHGPHDLEYSPASRSSSSGFASRNTSQSQPSPHQPLQPLVSNRQSEASQPPPLPPLSSHPLLTRNLVDVSTDENYEFDADVIETTSGRQLNRSDDQPEVVVPGAISGAGASVGASFSPKTSNKITKYDDVEIERRIPVLKEEFQQFRRRQLERRRSDEMESEC